MTFISGTVQIELLLTLLTVLALILASAFFSGAETALTAASRARMHAMDQEGNPRAKLVNQLLARPGRLIGTVLVGNTLVNTLASAVSTSFAIRQLGDVGVAYATVVITVLAVIFAEVLPKTYALVAPDKVALAVAPAVRVVIWLLSPAVRATEWVVRQILKLTPSHSDDKANILAAQEELRGRIDLQKREGTVVKHDADMLGGVLDLRDLSVLDVMVHRTKMQTVNADDPVNGIISAVLNSAYTRIPLWREEPDNIIGVLNTKDLLRALHDAGWDLSKIDVKSLASTAWFVPESTSLKDQLNEFLKRKTQLALVVDEYGEVMGLVTLEDILEEIVGQITDEHDDAHESGVRLHPDGSITADGAIPIRDINRQMEWSLPDEEATTIAGLVIHEAQTIPEPGQAFTFYGYRFEILRKQRNKITSLKIIPLIASAAGAPRTTSEAHKTGS